MPVALDGNAARGEPLQEPVVVAAAQRRMRFAGGAKVGVDAQVEVDVTAAQPYSAAGRELGRLGNLYETEQVYVKRTRRLLASRWDCDLNVVDSADAQGCGGDFFGGLPARILNASSGRCWSGG